MSVHFMEVYVEDGKAYCLICKSQVAIYGHSKECTALRMANQMSDEPSPILQYFNYKHLRPELQEIAIPFWSLAHVIEDRTPSGPEKSAGLRKLLEAKDCIIRASLKDGKIV